MGMVGALIFSTYLIIVVQKNTGFTCKLYSRLAHGFMISVRSIRLSTYTERHRSAVQVRCTSCPNGWQSHWKWTVIWKHILILLLHEADSTFCTYILQLHLYCREATRKPSLHNGFFLKEAISSEAQGMSTCYAAWASPEILSWVTKYEQGACIDISRRATRVWCRRLDKAV